MITSNKMYIRTGRKFVYVPNMVGMFWDGLHLLSKERRHDSIAMVIAQHYDHVTMCALAYAPKQMAWEDAKAVCKSYFGEVGRLPTRAELLLLKDYPDVLKNILKRAGQLITFWTNEEHSSGFAWVLGLTLDSYFGYCYSYNKDNYVSVLAFVDVPITDLIYERFI